MESRRKNTLRSLVWMSLALAAAVITLYVSWRFSNRRYYLTSVLLMIYCLLPFFFMFERRRPQAREMVVVAVMTALAIASRAAFIWTPGFKPMIAVIIITGIAMGPESGFLTGAMAAFVSNFLFGQGAWTPWQMFAYGFSGFVAGVLYQAGFLSKKRIPLSIFGGLLVICVIGPILDTCALCLSVTEITKAGAAAIYLSGLPVNVVHSIAVVLFLFFLSGPLFEKLDRIKEKYGLMEE